MLEKTFVYLGEQDRQDQLTEFIKLATRFFVVTTMALLVFVTLRSFYSQEIPSGKGAVLRRPVATKLAADNLEPGVTISIDQFRQVFQERDFFAIPYSSPLQPATPNNLPTQALSSGFDVSAYRLVGIVLDRKPQVVIEDLRNKQTLFLRPGESLEGAVLEEIQKDRARFLYQGQQWELIR